MTQRTAAKKKRVTEWNAKHPPGTAVTVTLDDKSTKDTTTRSYAEMLGGHSAVIWLKGLTGSFLLSRVRPK